MKKLTGVLALAISILGLFAATASATGPTIISPAVSGRTGANGIINVHYTLPDAPAANVSVTFTRETVGMPQTSFAVSGGALDQDLTFSAADPGSNAAIVNSTGPIVDGTYIVTIGYFSNTQGGYVATEHAGVIVDSTTKPATLYSPAPSSRSNKFAMNLMIDEDQAPGSLKVSLTGAGTCVLTLVDQERFEAVAFDINPAAPGASPVVASVDSGCSLPDGTYTVAVSYGDVWGNPASTTLSSNVTLDTSTSAPTLLSPATDDIFINRIGVHYVLPEDALPGSAQLVFTGDVSRVVTLAGELAGSFSLTFDPAGPTGTAGVISGDPIPDGVYSVKLEYQDAAGNAAASSAVANNVRVGPVPDPPDTESPAKPTGLNASAVTQTTATLGWSATTDNVGVTKYNVYKDGLLLATKSLPGASVGLLCGQTSHFRVSAEDAAGNESAQSESFDITGAACDAFAPPIAKLCLAPIKAISVAGKFKKGKKKVPYSLKITGKVAADGQSIRLTGAKKNTTFYFKVDGKTSTAGSITVANNPSLVTVIYKPTVGTNKTIRIQLKQLTC